MMRKNVVLPYKTLRSRSSALKAEPWYLKRADTDPEPLRSGYSIEDWSYDTPLGISRKIEVNLPELLRELDLESTGASLELMHILHVGTLGKRMVLHREVFEEDAEIQQKSIDIALDGHSLCERITLSSSIILRGELFGVAAWVPSRQGAIVWKDDTDINLEGYGSRFPMRAIPFSEAGRINSASPWHLEWSAALLHYSFNSAVTLLLNSDRKDFLEKVRAEDKVVMEQMVSGVMSEICAKVICSDEFLQGEGEFPEGSLGAVARSWIENALPSLSLHEARAQYEMFPSEFHTALRGLAWVI